MGLGRKSYSTASIGANIALGILTAYICAGCSDDKEQRTDRERKIPLRVTDQDGSLLQHYAVVVTRGGEIVAEADCPDSAPTHLSCTTEVVGWDFRISVFYLGVLCRLFNKAFGLESGLRQ